MIKEKDIIINKKNEEISNFNSQANKILELEDEKKQLESYMLLPGEQFIFIKFISTDQKINFSTAAKNNDIFTKIENILYENYPEFKESENYFLVGGRKVNRNKTIEENKIKNKDVLTLSKIDDDN